MSKLALLKRKNPARLASEPFPRMAGLTIPAVVVWLVVIVAVALGVGSWQRERVKNWWPKSQWAASASSAASSPAAASSLAVRATPAVLPEPPAARPEEGPSMAPALAADESIDDELYAAATPVELGRQGLVLPEPTPSAPTPSGAGPAATSSVTGSSTLVKELMAELARVVDTPSESEEEFERSLASGPETQNVETGGVAEIVASPSPSPSGAVKIFYTGQCRGYAALYLMHPNARPAVEEQVRILKEANVREVYLGVLTDGTFGLDYDYLNEVIHSLKYLFVSTILHKLTSSNQSVHKP